MIAKYLLEDIRELDDLGIYKVAEDCFISRSSIQRFIKTLGFNSFNDLKANAKEAIKHQEALLEYTDYTNHEEVLSGKIVDMMMAIGRSVTKEVLVHLAQAIHDAEKVIFLA